MQIKKGNDRIVILLPSLGIAIKLPAIHLWRAICLFCGRIKNGKWKRLKRDWKWPIEAPWGFKKFLFRGFVVNWRELRFYSQTRNPLLQPTYFSLFGLFNIQKAGEPCQLESINLWCQLREITDNAVDADKHHFSNPRNFCFNNGTLRMLDYGSRQSQEVILKFGAKIVQSFNSTYRWKRETT